MDDLKSSLEVLVRSYIATQRDRIAVENRLRTMNLVDDVRELLEEKAKEDRLFESKIRRKLMPLLKKFDEWVYWMKYVRGLGPILAAKYLVQIDWNKVRYPSSLYMYFGLICDEKGRAYRLKRGEKPIYLRSRKALVYNTVISFIKTGRGYRNLYDRFRQYEESRRRFTITIGELDDYYTGCLYLEEGRYLTRSDIQYLREKYPPSYEIELERSGAHVFLRTVRRVGKVFLSHMVMFHYWFNHNKLVLPYSVTHVNGHGKHVYMLVLDVDKDKLFDDRFMWWHTLYDVIRDDGREPVVL